MEKHKRGHHGHRDGKCHKKSHWLNEIKGGRGPRIERGEIRYILLDALKETERHGYEIMQAVAEKSGGFYKPSPGSVYPALQMMEDLEWIEPLEGSRKKKFQITELGLKELESQKFLIEDIYSDIQRISSPELDKFMEDAHIRFKMIMKGIYRAFQAGKLKTDDTRALKAIEDAIREMGEKVESILTNDLKK